MAAAHYQFEAIHPFADGNRRTGSILNILLLVEALTPRSENRTFMHRKERDALLKGFVHLRMAVVLLTALPMNRLPYGFFSVKLVEVHESATKFGPVGYEIILLYLVSLAALAFGGAGPLAVDQWRSSRRVRS